MGPKENQECEEYYSLTLYEVTNSFGVSQDVIMEIVEQGIVSVQKNLPEEWLFNNEELQSIKTVLRLNKDLGINIAGAALVLDLLKELEKLRA